jgi:hypothetical protein
MLIGFILFGTIFIVILSVSMPSVVILNVVVLSHFYCYSECLLTECMYAVCHIFIVILIVAMPSVVMLNVVMASVVAP